jgi:hypothetical protein
LWGSASRGDNLPTGIIPYGEGVDRTGIASFDQTVSLGIFRLHKHHDAVVREFESFRCARYAIAEAHAERAIYPNFEVSDLQVIVI